MKSNSMGFAASQTHIPFWVSASYQRTGLYQQQVKCTISVTLRMSTMDLAAVTAVEKIKETLSFMSLTSASPYIMHFALHLPNTPDRLASFLQKLESLEPRIFPHAGASLHRWFSAEFSRLSQTASALTAKL